MDGGTAKDVSDKLGVTPVTPEATVGSAIVVSTAGYYGRYAANVWEWMKAKLEQPANG